MSVVRYLRDRLGTGAPRTMPGGASFAHAFGWAVVFLIVVEGLSGAALAAFYSPSTTNAWASVAYIQDHETWGWLVRGIHAHGGGAVAIACGVHLLQTGLVGAYKKPRELTWWIGIVAMMLLLAWAVSGYVLRWDQAGFWGSHVEAGVIAGTPIVGDKLRGIVLGGNDYGNLTLTRVYMLHVIAFPALALGAIGLHVKLARKHGPTPLRAKAATVPRWPDQTIRDLVVMALAFGALVAYAVSTHGAELLAPADPSQAYDARPLWYYRWLYELRYLAGSKEELAALLAPAVVGGALAALPILDRGESRALRTRKLALAILLGVCGAITALTIMSFVKDAGDQPHQDALAKAETQALRARALAEKYGVPVTGALDVYKTPPMWQARTLFATRCAGCHTDPDPNAKPDPKAKPRTGPLIGFGHGDRAWLKAFLKDPAGAAYYGKSKLASPDVGMRPVDTKPDDLEDLIEMLYAETGAADVDAAKRDRGKKVFDKECTDCHTVTPNVSASGPNLFQHGSRDYLIDFIGNPKQAVHMGTDGEMPRFDKELTLIERDVLAGYLIWLRTASKHDVDALDPL